MKVRRSELNIRHHGQISTKEEFLSVLKEILGPTTVDESIEADDSCSDTEDGEFVTESSLSAKPIGRYRSICGGCNS